MQHGRADPVDPAPLAAALQLDHAVQQDGQEFMKLFLTLLEARFARQPALRGAIQGLFRGSAGYETVCQACERPSESSTRADNFYELDVPVKGFKTLEGAPPPPPPGLTCSARRRCPRAAPFPTFQRAGGASRVFGRNAFQCFFFLPQPPMCHRLLTLPCLPALPPSLRPAESLSSLLSPELLDGDNQYHCEVCGGKQDATRQLRLRQLPPLLALSLQRFVFDFVVSPEADRPGLCHA
jgi:hypothetical protein